MTNKIAVHGGLSDPLEVIPTVGSLPVYNTWIHTAHIAYVYNYTRLKK